MNVRLYTEGDRERWERFVETAPDSTLYHRIQWKDVVETTFGHRTYYLLAEDRNGIVGILPLVHLKSICFGSFMVSLPYFNYGGICAQGREAHESLLKEAVELARKEKASHIELRHTENLDLKLPVKSAKASMRLDLPATPEALWDSFPSKLRSQIRKPEKANLGARVGRADELDAFYEVFCTNMRDLGTPVYSKAFFRNILERFAGSTWICTVYMGGVPAASGFLAGFKNTVEIPWASSIKRYNMHSPNMLLYWSSLKFAVEKGYRVFDFGRSTPGEGTFKFKEQWGAKPKMLYWHYWLRDGGALPEINPKNPRYNAAINIWKRLPLSITKILGPGIVKNIP